MGAASIRHSPRPLFSKGASFMHSSGASRRGIADSCLMNTNAPHFQSSSPAKAGDPVFRGEKPRRTGYPACAGYDGGTSQLPCIAEGERGDAAGVLVKDQGAG